MVNTTFLCYLISLFSKKKKKIQISKCWLSFGFCLTHFRLCRDKYHLASESLSTDWPALNYKHYCKETIKEREILYCFGHTLQLTSESRAIFRACKPYWFHCSLFTSLIFAPCNSWCFWRLLLRPNLNFLYFNNFVRIMRSKITTQT